LNKKTAILLVSQYFSSRDYERYGIRELEKNDLNVQIWDLTNILYPNIIWVEDSTSIHNLKKFKKLKNIVQEINFLEKSTYFISTIIFNYKSYKIFRAISKNNLNFGLTGPYTTNHELSFNTKHKQISFIGRNKNLNFRLFFEKLLNKLIVNKIALKLFGFKYASHFFIGGGSQSGARGPLINAKTKLMHIHAANYDIYLKHKNLELSEDYILYLDQYIPFHSDFLFNNQDNTFEVNEYYQNLRFLFNNIERAYGLKVIIAAHPKANYEDKPGLFGDRVIKQGVVSSSKAIINAKMILQHATMTLSLCVLFKKPIIFLTSSSFNNTLEGSLINAYANYFNTIPLDCKADLSNINAHFADMNKYNEYVDAVVKMNGTNDESFWIQISNTIKKINN
jgi:hypothetical protein